MNFYIVYGDMAEALLKTGKNYLAMKLFDKYYFIFLSPFIIRVTVVSLIYEII